MKNSFSIFELIVVLIISTTIFIYSSFFIKELFLYNNTNLKENLSQIQLSYTKIFLEKNSHLLNNILYSNSTLYFQNSVLLDNVTEFKISKSSDFAIIQISLENGIFQIWEIKL